MVLQATKAAVSVRNRFEPKRTVVKPYSLASAISWGVKSPSGPINTRVSVFLLQTCCNKESDLFFATMGNEFLGFFGGFNQRL